MDIDETVEIDLPDEDEIADFLEDILERIDPVKRPAETWTLDHGEKDFGGSIYYFLSSIKLIDIGVRDFYWLTVTLIWRFFKKHQLDDLAQHVTITSENEVRFQGNFVENPNLIILNHYHYSNT